MLALEGGACHAGTVGDVPGTVRPAGEPGGDEEDDGPVMGKAEATATACPGGRLRRRPGGRQRVVGVRLSPEEEAWIVPRAAAEGLSVQRFLVESALPEGRPSLLARRALCREFLAVARDLHGACANLNQLTHIAHGWRCATAAPGPATTTSTSSWGSCAKTGTLRTATTSVSFPVSAPTLRAATGFR